MIGPAIDDGDGSIDGDDDEGCGQVGDGVVVVWTIPMIVAIVAGVGVDDEAAGLAPGGDVAVVVVADGVGGGDCVDLVEMMFGLIDFGEVVTRSLVEAIGGWR